MKYIYRLGSVPEGECLAWKSWLPSFVARQTMKLAVVSLYKREMRNDWENKTNIVISDQFFWYSHLNARDVSLQNFSEDRKRTRRQQSYRAPYTWYLMWCAVTVTVCCSNCIILLHYDSSKSLQCGLQLLRNSSAIRLQRYAAKCTASTYNWCPCLARKGKVRFHPVAGHTGPQGE